MSARIIALPTAAMEPVIQRPRQRGRYPAIVTLIQRGRLIKSDAVTFAKSKAATFAATADKELENAENFYSTAKRILASAEFDLQVARQRAGKKGGAA